MEERVRTRIRWVTEEKKEKKRPVAEGRLQTRKEPRMLLLSCMRTLYAKGPGED
jgi:hypothetical protein